MKTRFAVPARSWSRGVSLAAALAAASPALAAETYSFDKAHTTVGFQVRHIVTNVGGKFNDFTGTIQVDRAKPESSSVEFTIQAASINTNEPKRDEHLRSADFFDVATHPTVTFKSTSIKANGKDSWLVTGDLTMRGVTKQVTLPVTFLGEGKDPWGNEKMGFETAITVNRKDYGINWNKALDQGGVLVADEVKVQVSVEANKVKAPATN
jgi:polyisoprenoid-binding protein YceI